MPDRHRYGGRFIAVNNTAVGDIVRQIDQLSEEDQLLLFAQLALRMDGEWRTEADAARRVANERGITQEIIDRAIDQFRRELR